MGESVPSPLHRPLADLRRRLAWCGAVVLTACAVTFPHAGGLIAWLKQPYAGDLVFFAPTEALFAAIKVAVFGGIALTLPVLLYHLWRLFAPALLPDQRRWGMPALALALVLFALGVAFANFVIVPLALQFMLQFGVDRGLTPQIGVGLYVDFTLKFLLTFGIAFELPLLCTLLSRLRMLTPGLLVRYRKHAVMVNLMLAAILTPTSDLFNLMLMAGPLILLYEIGILSARLFGRPTARPPTGDEVMPDAPTGTAGRRVI